MNKVNKDKHNTINKRDFSFGKYEYNQCHIKGLKFSFLYEQNKIWFRYFISIVIGLVMAFFVQIFVKNTGLCNSGLGGITQGISRLVNCLLLKNNVNEETAKIIFNFLFWGLFLIFNLPLLIMGYFKIGKTFAKLTFVFLLSNAVFGFLISYIPGIETVLILGDPNPSSYSYNEQEIPNYLAHNYQIKILPISYGRLKTIFLDANGMITTDETKCKYILFHSLYDPIKTFYLIMYGISFGIILSFHYSILYIIGSSSAGTDLISFYYAIKKHKPIGGVIVIINSLSIIIGITLGSYIPSGIVLNECWNYHWFTSANLISGILTVLVFRFILNILYPNNKFIKIDIYTKKPNEIIKNLNIHNYHHSFTLVPVSGSYTKNNYILLQTICMYYEINKIISFIREIDKSCIIAVYLINGFDGKIKQLRQGSLE